MLDAGKRNTQINIYNVAYTNVSGNRTQVRTLYGTKWANVAPVSARTQAIAQSFAATVDVVFTVAYDPGILDTMIIEWDGFVASVNGSYDPASDRAETKIFCTKTEAAQAPQIVDASSVATDVVAAYSATGSLIPSNISLSSLLNASTGVSGFSGFSGASGNLSLYAPLAGAAFTGNLSTAGNFSVTGSNVSILAVDGGGRTNLTAGNLGTFTNIVGEFTTLGGNTSDPQSAFISIDAHGVISLYAGSSIDCGGGAISNISQIGDTGTTYFYGDGSHLTGLNGFSGFSGFSGKSGFSGVNGSNGASGFSGFSGATGGTGSNGSAGASGFSGFSGKSGFSGFSGTGFSGFSGFSGASGNLSLYLPLTGGTLTGNTTIDVTGSTSSSPTLGGFSNLASGTYARLQYGDAFNCFQNGNSQKMQLTSYWGMEIWGSHQSTSAIAFSGGSTTDPVLNIAGTQVGTTILQLSAPASQTANLITANVNGANKFVVDHTGNLTISSAGATFYGDVDIRGNNLYNAENVYADAVQPIGDAGTNISLGDVDGVAFGTYLYVDSDAGLYTFQAGDVFVNGGKVISAGTRTTYTTLTDGSTISTTFGSNSYFKVTIAGNRTLANPTSASDGDYFQYIIKQDGTGGRTLTLGSNFDTTLCPSFALNSAANAITVFSGYYDASATKFRITGFANGT